MSKTVTLRLSDDVYQLFRQSAENDNRPLSNFIETATKRFIEQSELVDDAEMAEIRGSAELNRSLDRGHTDARSKRGRPRSHT
jgi:predicted transcriptional regulator